MLELTAQFTIFVDFEMLFIGIFLTFMLFPTFELIQHFAKRNLEELMGLCAFAVFGAVLFIEVLIAAPLYNLSLFWLAQLVASLALPSIMIAVGTWASSLTKNCYQFWLRMCER